MWDSQTHPKHFPGQMSSWSSLIGCSHSNNYHIWRLGELASPGVKKVSEMGSVWSLEKEMKQQGKVVHSVIKAPGLWWGVGQSQPTKFAADPQHNLFSVMSRIIPSPDWFVGIDSLNLCHLNCTWKDEESVDLFPVDAGTDDGINFISVNSQSTPQQPITRISTRLHDHPKASFYLPDNDVIRPFARIKIEKMAIKLSIVKCLPGHNGLSVIDLVEARREEQDLY
ncbi:Spondin-1 [Exaiptasia diaphana]|nr:Spondin-1 [Exaiptasia diaphana]